MTESEVAKLVALLVATYPVPSWEKQTMIAYREMLLDLDAATTSQVVHDWIKTRDERPTIAQIRRAVAQRQVSGFLAPDEAWALVERAFGTVGRYREFPADQPLVKQAVDGVGWATMCSSENPEALRAQFRGAYSALLERSLSETAASAGAAEVPAVVRPLLERTKLALVPARGVA